MLGFPPKFDCKVCEYRCVKLGWMKKRGEMSGCGSRFLGSRTGMDLIRGNSCGEKRKKDIINYSC